MIIKDLIINIAKFIWTFLFNFSELRFAAKLKYAETIQETDIHIHSASDWLIRSQEMSPDDGYSRYYSIYKKKWDKSYIETTGYIIPTLIKVDEHFNTSKYSNSAMDAADWLLQVQNENGSFCDIDNNIPQVFDTGQCLIGLNFLYLKTSDRKYLDAAIKAADWLCEVQNQDGSWTSFSYNNEPHSYYTRVSSAILNLYDIVKNEKYLEHGLKNIFWCINNQKKNGFFKHASFSYNEKPVLHTMIYILEGLLEAYEITKDKRILDAILLNAEKLKEINLNRDIILYSRYDETFSAFDKTRCITGLSQWAGVCLDLFKITDDMSYLRLAKRTIYYLKSKHIMNFNTNMNGAFFGSIPFYANYGPYKLLNWNNKFFIDTLLKYKNFDEGLEDEHDEWTCASFQFLNDETVNENLTEHDLKYIQIIQPIIENALKHKRSIKLLDVGCGKGKFIDYLSNKYTDVEFFGVDPVYFNNSKNCINGTATNIPFSDNTFDIVILIEVLQHVRVLNNAILEVNRVTSEDGYIFIGERNKYSLLGFLKSIFEKSNMWMYIADSPFKEKWYKKTEWKKSLEGSGFKLILIKNVNTLKSKIPLMNRYIGIIGKKGK